MIPCWVMLSSNALDWMKGNPKLAGVKLNPKIS